MYDIRICVGCLATSVKMFSMRSRGLLEPYRLLTGIQLNDGMPEKLCWECAALVNKFYVFRHKCERAHRLLTDIYQRHGEVKTEYLSTMDRKMYNLESSFTYHVIEEKQIKTKRKGARTKAKELVKRTRKSKERVASVEETQLDIENVKLEDDNKVEVKVEMLTDDDFHEYSFTDDAKKEDAQNESDDKLKIEDDRCAIVTAPKKKRIRGVRSRPAKVSAEKYGTIEESLTHEQRYEIMKARQSSKTYLNARFPCDLCYRGFNSHTTYSTHMQMHDPKFGDFICDICLLRYKTRLNLYKHIALNHMHKYTCQICCSVRYNRYDAQKHYDRHMGTMHTCHVCGVTLKKALFSNHLRNKHALEYICVHCGEPFYSQKGLTQHIGLRHAHLRNDSVGEAGGLYCAVCSVQFTCQQAWTRHVLISPKHTHERHLFPHGCDKCGDNFESEDSLNAHKVVHPAQLNKEHIVCEQCGEMQVGWRTYHEHFRQEHPGASPAQYLREGRRDSSYMCDVCGKTFSSKNTINQHIMIHTGERMFKCDTCAKRFKTPYELTLHKRSHTKEKPHVCKTCGKRFTVPSNLSRHQLVHTDAKPYTCECGKSFKDRARLKLHVDFVHLKKPWPKRDRRGKGKRDA